MTALPPAVAGPARRPALAVLLALAWLVVVLQLLIPGWAGTAETLNDTDDAMRLVELRAFLGGAGWFDLHMTRIAPPEGYDPHWSRLVDAGLAGLFRLLAPFAGADLAERLMRTAWPLLWLLPAMAGTMAVAARLAGREGALIALLFAVVGLPAFQQFTPGRIDHHNVQIALGVLALAATVWSDRVRAAAVAAGLLTALALAIGFECLPFMVVCGGAMALRFVADPTAARPLAAYGFALAAGAGAAFAVEVGPARALQTACDALAVNSALALVVAGASLALAAGAARSAPARFGAVALAGVATATVYVVLEPRCLGGPFAMTDPAVWPIWLAHVQEMQPLFALARDQTVIAVAIAAFPAFALVVAALLASDRAVRSDFACLATVAQLVVAAALTMSTAKVYNYAMWFAMPLVALAAARLNASLALGSLAARAFAAILLSPSVVSALAIVAAQAAGAPAAAVVETADRKACFRSASYATLAALPEGLVAADIDHGPFILALTPHAVLAGPYHRLSAAIIATHEVFARPPHEARALLARHGATYVAICGPRGPAGLSEAARAASLWGRLQAGAVPDWLERLPSGPDDRFRIYRIRPSIGAAAAPAPRAGLAP